MKLTNIRQRYYRAYQFKTTSYRVLPVDSSAVFEWIAVSPQEHTEDDVLEVVVGDFIKFEHPLKPLMDMYHHCHANLFLQIEHQFAVLIDAAIEGGLREDSLSKIRDLHQDMWRAPEDFGGVGLKLPIAILVPPRQEIGVKCQKGSRVDVYLGGVVSVPL